MSGSAGGWQAQFVHSTAFTPRVDQVRGQLLWSAALFSAVLSVGAVVPQALCAAVGFDARDVFGFAAGQVEVL